jgi:hypothetical protein
LSPGERYLDPASRRHGVGRAGNAGQLRARRHSFLPGDRAGEKVGLPRAARNCIAELSLGLDYASKHLLRALLPTVEAIRPVLDELEPRNPKVKGQDPKRFFDDGFVRELHANGFILC